MREWYHSIKKQSKTEPGNYRPVSILSVTSKILERMVYNQLDHYLKETNLLYKLQSGFRPFFSTGTCLTFLMDYIRSETDFGNYIGMVMIDLQKAFDTVDHSIFENKLKAIGLDGANPGASSFLIYVNDMEASFSCKLILYADDSARKTHKN